MCGAFGLYFSFADIKDRFSVSYSGTFAPRYNIRPSQEVPIILNTEPDQLTPAVWGFDLRFGDKKHFVFNTRKDSLAKPYAAKSFRERRCLIPATGFYEWAKVGTQKVPHLFQLTSHEPFAFAGIWKEETDEVNGSLPHFSIITTEPNELVGKVHDRMPVILKQEDERDWIDPDLEPERALKMLAPFPTRLMESYVVSTLVNSPRNDTNDILKPVDITGNRKSQ
jgi:putative SOS response-associated peptidase YedK